MKSRRADAVLVGLSSLVPACLAASHVGNVADAAHDAGVARVLGLDPQAWRALDVVVGAVLALAPVGTRSSRAALGGVLVVAAMGAVLYFIARRLLARCAQTPHLGFFVAAIAATTPLVAAPWQIEGAAVGGSVTGAFLAVLPVALIALVDEQPAWPGLTFGVAFALGLALGHEPLDGACAFAGCAAYVATSLPAREALARSWREQRPLLLASPLAGLAPLAVAIVRVRSTGAPFAAALGSDWAGERGLSHGGPPWSFLSTELGVVLVLLTIAGTLLAMLVPGARPLASSLVAVTVSGFGCAWLGAPLGPTRFGAPVLAGFATASVLAGVAMQAVVRATATAKVPMRRASAAMIVVLEVVLPVDMADDGLVRAAPRAAGAASTWDDAAWGSLPPATVVLLTDSVVFARARAAQAGGRLRGDLTLVPTFLHDARAWRALAADPALVPLWRDLELVGAPGEASLSSLATLRPLAMPYVPEWGKSIGKHLVPVTLFDRFEPEPRGASDRRRGLDAFAALREPLQRGIAGDPELMAAAADLLQARARLVTDLSSDPDLVARTAADVRAFLPQDPAVARAPERGR
jgi:hypothetical protein